MKKLIVCMSIAAALLSGTVALAAENVSYDTEDYAVSGISGDTYKTVLITKDDVSGDESIVYVGQAASGSFDASTKFLIKENPADGWYTIALGGTGEAAVKSQFYIGEIQETSTEVEADKVFIEEGTETDQKKVSFGWEEIDGAYIKSIILTLDGKTLGHNFDENDNIPEIAIGSPVNFGVEITGVPGNTATASARLSSEILAFENSNTEGE